MKIVVFGNKKTTKAFLENLISKQYKPHTLVTLDASLRDSFKISGVDNKLIDFALKNQINIYNPTCYKLSGINDYEFFNSNNFDIGFCTGWQRIIPEVILKVIKAGVFGWHGSGFEFPNGRGRSPINWTMRLGLNNIHHNCFKYSSGIDDGDIYETKNIKIETTDYISDVICKVLKHINDSSISVLEDLSEHKLKLFKQPNHTFFSFPKLDENDGELNLQMNRSSAINIVRSCSRPFPGSFIMDHMNNKIRIWKMYAFNDEKFTCKKDNIFYHDDKIILNFLDGKCFSNDYEILK